MGPLKGGGTGADMGVSPHAKALVHHQRTACPAFPERYFALFRTLSALKSLHQSLEGLWTGGQRDSFIFTAFPATLEPAN